MRKSSIAVRAFGPQSRGLFYEIMRSWDFFGRNDVEAETPTLATSCEELTHWNRLWCWEGLEQKDEGTTEDEMAGLHHQLDEHEFE